MISDLNHDSKSNRRRQKLKKRGEFFVLFLRIWIGVVTTSYACFCTVVVAAIGNIVAGGYIYLVALATSRLSSCCFRPKAMPDPGRGAWRRREGTVMQKKGKRKSAEL